ncbi:type VI secretion system-associated FHA domain protein TagH [Aliikangiella sp. IMCC44359]|uniref:type VI secretion system-associated FHA domain protein TagH n=1 Tax=Aliikangiella sp. IMCC44359 TaxID=3459125 RepID=UPI00403AE578
MFIVVTVTEFPEGTSLIESSMTFDQQGATIGRNDSNTWVLADPDRFLSGCHCEISFEGGVYYLVDKSTNGTFVNNSSEPLGKGNKVALNTGDQFELSDYKFKVKIGQSSEGAAGFDAPPPSNSFMDSDDPFGQPSIEPEPVNVAPLATDPFGTSNIPESLPTDSLIEETDPLAALDKMGQSSEPYTSQPKESFGHSYSDNANVIGQSVSWPNAAPQEGLIPEDWDSDDLMVENKPEPLPPIEQPIAQPKPEPKVQPEPQQAPAAQSISVSESEARRRALEKAYRKLKQEVASLKKQLASTQKRSSSGVDSTLVDGMGFKDRDLDDDKIAEINEISGELIRQMIEGMMQTLSSRNNVKNTFRMNMTTIQPIENNPLKFSANVDDALENMFLKEGNSYKKPLEAIQESFESIADHQVAILAGIRSAFKSIVNRFEPSVLETRFEKQNKRSFIALNEKARHWDAFNEYYSELFSDLDSSFQYLFGDEFSQAYEEQLQVLSLARKEKTKSTKLGN